MINNKTYDVVIVGSGISGAVMAKTLTQAGKTVLLLEAGLTAGINLDRNGDYQNYVDYLNTFYTASAKVPNSPYPNIKMHRLSTFLTCRQSPGPIAQVQTVTWCRQGHYPLEATACAGREVQLYTGWAPHHECCPMILK